jgi:hypothetical protein
VVVAVDHGALLLVEDRCCPTSTHDEHGKSQRSHFTRRRRCVPAADFVKPHRDGGRMFACANAPANGVCASSAPIPDRRADDKPTAVDRIANAPITTRKTASAMCA